MSNFLVKEERKIFSIFYILATISIILSIFSNNLSFRKFHAFLFIYVSIGIFGPFLIRCYIVIVVHSLETCEMFTSFHRKFFEKKKKYNDLKFEMFMNLFNFKINYYLPHMMMKL